MIGIRARQNGERIKSYLMSMGEAGDTKDNIIMECEMLYNEWADSFVYVKDYVTTVRRGKLYFFIWAGDS